MSLCFLCDYRTKGQERPSPAEASPDAVFCTQCGRQQNSATDRFCANCGTAYPVHAEDLAAPPEDVTGSDQEPEEAPAPEGASGSDGEEALPPQAIGSADEEATEAVPPQGIQGGEEERAAKPAVPAGARQSPLKFWGIAAGALIVVALIGGCVTLVSLATDDQGGAVTGSVKSPAPNEVQAGQELSTATARQDVDVQPQQEAAGPTASEASLVDECLAFLDDLTPVLTDGTDAMGSISDLSFDAALNPLLALDGGWQADVRAEYGKLRAGRADVDAVRGPTAGLESVRLLLVEGFDQIIASEAPLLQGAQNLDPEQIDDAANRIIAAADTLTKASTMMETFDPIECGA